jgi:iron complex outermembrane recepter protein
MVTKSTYLTIIGLFFMGILAAQSGSISGTVRTADGSGLEFVSIVIPTVHKGGVTDVKGDFQIDEIPVGTHKVTFKFIGYAEQEIEVPVKSGLMYQLPAIVMQEDNATLGEVVVRSAKRGVYVVEKPSESLRINTPLIETPQNIAVVTNQTIRDFGLVGTSEMARLTSGIIKRYGGANDFAFTIRGTDATNNNFRNGVGNYWWNQQADAFMIDRVEFVKGPAGFMIGNSEPGGLLNEVTKQADGQRVREAQVGYGSFNMMRAGIDVGDKLAPNSKWSYRMVVGGQRQNGAYDFYQAYRTYLMPSVRYTYKNGAHIQAELIRMDGHSKADNYANISFRGDDFLFPLRFNSTDPNVVKGIETDDNYVRLSHVHPLGKGWQIKTQVADVRGRFRGSSMYVSQMSANFDTMFRSFYHINWRNRLQTAQSFVDGTFYTSSKIKHSILAGLDYGRTSVNTQFGDLNDPDVWGDQLPLSVRNPVYNLTAESVQDTTLYPADNWGTQWTALYVQDHIKFFDRLVLTLAGRLSHTAAWASYDSVTVYDTKFTPRLGLTYLLSKNASLYALFDETFLPQTGRKEDRTAAKPLTGTNTELGFKAQLLDKRLSINTAVFRTIKNNVLVQNPQTDFYVERGQITSEGFEFDITGNLTRNVMVNANYAYTDARITQDADPSIVGFRNYAVATHVGNAMIRYRILNGVLSGLSAGFGVQMLGDRSAVWAGWTDPKDKDKAAPAYTIFDANIAYEHDRFALRLNVFNLGNKRYMDSAWWNSSFDETKAGYFTFAAAQPINFRLGAEFHF